MSEPKKKDEEDRALLLGGVEGECANCGVETTLDELGYCNFCVPPKIEEEPEITWTRRNDAEAP